MKFLIMALAVAVASAQQYYDQGLDFQFQPAGAKPKPMAQREQGRGLSGFPQNNPQNMPVGHTDPRQQSGCKNENPTSGQTPYNNQQQQQQPRQPSGAYIPPPQYQNQQQPQAYNPQQYQQPQQNQQQYPSSGLGYSANQQVGQAVPPPQNLYEILHPQKNEVGDDYQSRQETTEKPRYPLTPPALRFKIGLVADLGKESKTKNGTFMSYLLEGHLIVHKINKANKDKEAQDEPTPSHNVTIEFMDDDFSVLESGLNDAGEGLDLSTLNVFNGKLYSCDDQTGIIYELATDSDDNVTAIPWVILPNDDGKRKTIKCEWATVKDNHLWLGSLGIAVADGKETKGKQSIAKVSKEGKVTCLDWSENYDKIAKALEIDLKTGFVNHEAAAWSDVLQKWIFTPRRVSTKKFDKATIEKTGSNLAVLTDDTFNAIETKKFGELVETSGFTSIKFIPGSQDQLILTLKAEVNEKTKKATSTLSVYDIEGNEIMKPTKVGDAVFAGVEFL